MIEKAASPEEKMKPLQSVQASIQKQIDSLDPEADKDEISNLQAQKKETRIEELNQIGWKTIWGIPAIGAAAILLFFIVSFSDEPDAADDSETAADAGGVADELAESSSEGESTAPEQPEGSTDE